MRKRRWRIKDPSAYLTPEEVDSLIAKAKNIRDALIIRLLFMTGVRVTELVTITVEHILFSDRLIVIKALKKKGEVYRRVAVDAKTLESVKQYMQKYSISEGYLFPGKDNGHLGRWTVWIILKVCAKKAKLGPLGDPLILKYRGVSPHKLRHAHGVAWVKKSPTMESMRRLQMQLGHQNINTTFGYLSQSALELHQTYDEIFESK